jgi:uncharacterized damage-inducible protein DinB
MESKSSDSVRIRRQLETAFSGPAWHGPALMENLAGISAEIAVAKPVPGAHAIWEIVNHLLVWQNEAAAVIDGKPYVTLTGDADWPPVTDPSAPAWEATVKELAASHQQLCSRVDTLSDERLREHKPDSKYVLLVFLRGIADHNLYHAGQIGLLKRAAQ